MDSAPKPTAEVAAPQTGAVAPSLANELYEASGAKEFGMAADEFAAILVNVRARYLPESATAAEAEKFCRGLRIGELALARGCAAGNAKAWEVFLIRFREKLYDAARAIVHDDAGAHELADSLYADLYGTRVQDGRRCSKLESYSGRGSLEGWLRMVLAQEFVNRYRSSKRLVSLEEQTEAGVQFADKAGDAVSVADPRLEQATDEALASLNAEERFILASYYLDGRRLAEIAKTLGVHESTVSRKVERLGKDLRKKVVAGLRQRGMNEREAAEAMESDVRDVRVDVRAKLAQETRGAPFSEKDGRGSAGGQ